MARAKLLHGKSSDIIDANIMSLKNTGLSHAHATHLALKHSNKNHVKKAASIAMKAAKPTTKMVIKPGGYDA
jgi:hypothetical protein